MVRDGARGINTSLLSVLGIVDVVTLYPPSERQDDFRRWGPWEDQEKAFQLEVYRTTTSSRSQYSYEMHGKRIGDSEWRVLLSGELLEGNTASAGRGKLFLDLDAISSIDPASQDKDRFSVDYDTRSNGLSFDLIIRSSSVSLSSAVTKQIRNEQFMSADILARYSYLETENGAGHFKIEGPTDVHKDSDPNLSQQEFLTISARWAADQKGRAETTIEGGDTEDALRASECWDDSFVLTYRDARFGAITDICGLVENCGAEFQSSDFLR